MTGVSLIIKLFNTKNKSIKNNTEPTTIAIGLIYFLSIVILLAFRCVIAETILSKHINVDVRKFIFEEIIMVMIFILSSWFVKGYFGFILYFISYVLYMIFNKKNIEILIKEIREKRKLK